MCCRPPIRPVCAARSAWPALGLAYARAACLSQLSRVAQRAHRSPLHPRPQPGPGLEIISPDAMRDDRCHSFPSNVLMLISGV